jgi:hypothetical protein
MSPQQLRLMNQVIQTQITRIACMFNKLKKNYYKTTKKNVIGASVRRTRYQTRVSSCIKATVVIAFHWQQLDKSDQRLPSYPYAYTTKNRHQEEQTKNLLSSSYHA